MTTVEQPVLPYGDVFSALAGGGYHVPKQLGAYVDQLQKQIMKEMAPYGATNLADLASVIQRGLLPPDEVDALANLAAKLRKVLETGCIIEGKPLEVVQTTELPGHALSLQTMPSGDVVVDIRYKLGLGTYAFGIMVMDPHDGHVVYQSDYQKHPFMTEISGVTSANGIVFRDRNDKSASVEILNPYTGDRQSTDLTGKDFRYDYCAARDEVTIFSERDGEQRMLRYDVKEDEWTVIDLPHFCDIRSLYGVLPGGEIVTQGHDVSRVYIIDPLAETAPIRYFIPTSSPVQVLPNGGMVYSGNFFGNEDALFHDTLTYIPPGSSSGAHSLKQPIRLASAGSAVAMIGGFGQNERPLILVSDQVHFAASDEYIGRIHAVDFGSMETVDCGQFVYDGNPTYMTTVGGQVVLASGNRLMMLEERRL